MGWNPNGTAVGNPTDMALHIAPAEGASFQSASTRISTISVATCSGETTVRTVEDDFDLLGLSTLRVEGGEWCSFSVLFDAPLDFTGTFSDGSAFSFSLVVESMVLGATNAVSSDLGPFVVELAAPEWLSLADALELTAGGGSSGAASKIEKAIGRDSALYRDDLADGEVGDVERAEGSLADGNTSGDGDGGDDDQGQDQQ